MRFRRDKWSCLQRRVMLAAALSPLPLMADESEDLARQLANPIASLISVPIEVDFDRKLGPGRDGDRTLLVSKAVVPFSLSDDWNLITRTIIPFIDLDDIAPGVEDESGLGDVLASFFFSPKAPTAGGWILGVGPIGLLPTATTMTAVSSSRLSSTRRRRR